eukprot:6213604-Pleurochrysis_carterae.AAC.3
MLINAVLKRDDEPHDTRCLTPYSSAYPYCYDIITGRGFVFQPASIFSQPLCSFITTKGQGIIRAPSIHPILSTTTA